MADHIQHASPVASPAPRTRHREDESDAQDYAIHDAEAHPTRSPRPQKRQRTTGSLTDDSDTTSPDIMNDLAFDTPSRTATNTSASPSDDSTQSCRICRSEGSPEEPLFHPCKCSGSIKFVHQECLMEWLSHSHKKHCELCKTAFRFTKLYDADMPAQLPWEVFLKRAVVHVGQAVQNALRGVLVGVVWMVILPWLIRWSWRWMFWFADAGWARDIFLYRLKTQSLTSMARDQGQASGLGQQGITSGVGAVVNNTGLPIAYNLANDFLGSMGIDWLQNNNSTTFNQTATPPFWSEADTSIFSSWTYLSEMTPSPHLNRIILDIFEGQLITCVIIIGFILVFLIREWVVQQQPMLNNVEQAAQQVREATEQMRAETERLRQHQALLEEAQRRMREPEREAESFIGWARLEVVVDEGTTLLLTGDREGFEAKVNTVVEQTRMAPNARGQLVAGVELADQVHDKLAGYDEALRQQWEKSLAAAFKATSTREGPGGEAAAAGLSGETPSDSVATTSSAASSSTRPHMPDREFSSQATQIQHLLEEADGIFGPRDGHGQGSEPDVASSSREADRSQTAHGSPSLVSSSSGSSWQNVTPQNEASQSGEGSAPLAATPASLLGHPPFTNETQVPPATTGPPAPTTVTQPPIPRLRPSPPSPLASQSSKDDLELPITNAGPDAKINIKRSGKGKARAVPEPKTKEQLAKEKLMKMEDKELQALIAKKMPDLKERLAKLNEEKDEGIGQGDEAKSASDGEDDSQDNGDDVLVDVTAPTGPAPANEESLSHRVASVFREEFGLDEAEELENLRQAGLRAANEAEANVDDENNGDDDDDDDEDTSDDTRAREPEQPRPRSYFERAADWFWGDIQVTDTPAPVPAGEAHVAAPNNDNDDGQAEAAPAPAREDEVRPLRPPEPQQDPEVVAAAAQAGLDAEAVEDAEDLEGILELIGLQGPLVGLFQTSMFCLVLVAGTVLGAVDLPYIWGKLVLSFIGSPVYFCFTLPLQVASFAADVVVDGSLFVGAWIVTAVSVCSEALFSTFPLPIAWFVPMSKITDAAARTASASGGRLQQLFVSDVSGGMGWNGAFLSASVHAHASLKNLQAETDAVLDFCWQNTVATAKLLSSGSFTDIWHAVYDLASHIPALLSKAVLALQNLWQSTKLLLASLASLKGSALTLSIPSTSPTSIDPSLVFWSSNDRYLTILTGYAALALLATIYCTIDKPITSSPSGQRLEKTIRDTLRQAGGVLKVILIISIEMLVFPLYCGLLLDLAFLPLFENANLATRLAFAGGRPYTFGFMHWFVGTCYMFHFALFVGMCRKILRKGVLWFIRDPDDPTFHPVRDVLERNVATQLRKIAFSALVYGALVILCLGGVIWSIGEVFGDIFPVCWMSTEPVLEFPADLLVFNFLTPVVVRLFRPSDAVGGLYAWWLRKCARALRLSHFLFDDRRKDEEGKIVHRTWASLLLMRRPNVPGLSPDNDGGKQAGEEVTFHRNGKYVLTPCNDQYRPPKPGEAFLHTPDDDPSEVYIADKDGKKNEHFAAIYVPPLFRVRVTLFMVCLWLFSAFMGLSVTLVPLVFGRKVLTWMAPDVRWNDIYAYSLGAYTLGGAGFAAWKGGAAVRKVRERARALDLPAWLAKATSFAVKSAKCAYVYGFLGLVLPLVFALALQFYVILPLHTYVASHSPTSPALPSSPSNSTAPDTASAGFTVATHTLHILQDYALGLLYVRLATQSIFRTPSSRPAEAFRRITSAGYLNPNAALATRIFILPLVFFSALVLLVPAGAAHLLLNSTHIDGEAERTLVYRYAYPAFASIALAIWSAVELGHATARWRIRVRDEVYLVGEKLHNWGEAKPPKGSRSVVRKGGAITGSGSGRVVERGVGEHEI